MAESVLSGQITEQISYEMLILNLFNFKTMK